MIFACPPPLFGSAAAAPPPPPTPPDPVLRDTFTAPDETDPTTRDIDVHPDLPGMDRWATYVPSYSAGTILGGALVNDAAAYSSGPYTLLEVYTEDNSSFISETSFATYMDWAGVEGGGSINCQVFADTGEQAQWVLDDGACNAYVTGTGDAWTTGSIAAETTSA